VCRHFEKLAIEYLKAATYWREETLRLTKGKTTAKAVRASWKTAFDAHRACVAFYHKKCHESHRHAVEQIARTKGIHGLHKRSNTANPLR